jgi:hypothetical protein
MFRPPYSPIIIIIIIIIISCVKTRKAGTHNNRHFGIKLAPEFFDAKFIICIKFPDKSKEGLTQVIDFKNLAAERY